MKVEEDEGERVIRMVVKEGRKKVKLEVVVWVVEEKRKKVKDGICC